MISFIVFLSVCFLNSPVSCDQLVIEPVQKNYTLVNGNLTFEVYYPCKEFSCIKYYYQKLTRDKVPAIAKKINDKCNGLDYEYIGKETITKPLNSSYLKLHDTGCKYENEVCKVNKTGECIVWEVVRWDISKSYLYNGTMNEWTLSNDPLVKYITFSDQDKTYQLKLIKKVIEFKYIWETDQEGIFVSTEIPKKKFTQNLSLVIPKNINFDFGIHYNIPHPLFPDINILLSFTIVGAVLILVILNIVILIVHNKLMKKVDKIIPKYGASKRNVLKAKTSNKELFYEYVDYNTLGLPERKETDLKDVVYDSVVNDIYKK